MELESVLVARSAVPRRQWEAIEARQAAIHAGIPQTVPSMTINKVCGSGLKAVHLAAQAIRCGDAELVVAGGQESMSLAPHVVPSSRSGTKMGDWVLKDSMIVARTWDTVARVARA